MADKERIRKGMKNGAFESPVGDNLIIGGMNVKPEEKDFTITVGNEALEGLRELGVNEDKSGVMTIQVYNTEERRVSKPVQEEMDR